MMVTRATTEMRSRVFNDMSRLARQTTQGGRHKCSKLIFIDSVARPRIWCQAPASASAAAPYSFNLLNRVLRLIPRISAARVLLFLVCCSVT